MPGFVRAFAGHAFTHGGAHCTADHAGAALWLPPPAHSDEAAVGEIVQRTLSPATREDLGAAMARLAACHPVEPHWYLPMIGVDPAHQGRGLGAALLTHTLRLCDRDHRPAYLESTNPRNVALYERHGFRVMDRVQVGGSPPFTPMVRAAR
jgi:ribosomal protein S18 acetylase RimI-like enzyme